MSRRALLVTVVGAAFAACQPLTDPGPPDDAPAVQLAPGDCHPSPPADPGANGGSGGPLPDAGCRPVRTVDVEPDEATLRVGESFDLTVILKGRAGNLITGRDVTWMSSDAAVATVDSDGTVQALAAGLVTITAESEGVTGTASIRVEPAWCDVTLTFDGGQLPSGWAHELIRNGPGLINDRLEAHAIDSGIRINAQGSAGPGLQELVVEFDRLHAFSSSAMSTLVSLPISPTRSYRINAFNGGSANIPDHLYFRAHFDKGVWPHDTNQVLLFDRHTAFQFGVYHYRHVYRDGEVDITATRNGVTVFEQLGMPLPGFLLDDIRAFYFSVYTTIPNDTWVDDLSIDCVR